MELLIWVLAICLAVFLIFRGFAYVAARLQTGRAIEAFVIGAKAPQVGQELAWWHLDGKRFMVAAGYIMGIAYSREDKEARYNKFEDILEIARDICTVETVTKHGQQLEAKPPNEVRTGMRRKRQK